MSNTVLLLFSIGTALMMSLPFPCDGATPETEATIDHSKWRRKSGSDEKENSPWVDPDTPQDARTIVSFPVLNISDDSEREFDLVFSDEFNIDDRTMNDGRDPRWTALHSDDLTNNPLHWYSHDAVTTHDGILGKYNSRLL